MLGLFIFLFLFVKSSFSLQFEEEFCNPLNNGRIWTTQDELLEIIQSRSETDSSSPHGLMRTDPHMFQWMAFYRTKWPISRQQERCGGVLISDSAVLTAAQCLRRNNETALVNNVTLGVFDIQHPGDSMLEIPVERSVVHERFNRTGTLDYDLAILILKEKIVWSQSPEIRPICLPKGTDHYTKAIVTGWGFSQDDREFYILQQGDETVYDQHTCSYAFNRILESEVMSCSGSFNPDFGCKGDIGGPVISHRPDQPQYHLIGIVSGQGNCVVSSSPAGAKYISVFTKIADERILNWIHDKLLESSCPAKTALEKHTAYISGLERTVEEMTTALENVGARNAELNIRLESTDKALELMETVTVRFTDKFEVERTLRDREIELERVVKEKSELGITLRDRDTEKSDLERTLRDIETEKSDLERTLRDTETDLERIKGENSNLEKKLAKVIGENTVLEGTLRNRNRELLNITEEKSALEKIRRDQNSVIAWFEADNSEFKKILRIRSTAIVIGSTDDEGSKFSDFDDRLNGPISAIRMRSGLWLDGIGVRYGDVWTSMRGGEGGNLGDICHISDIVKVEGYFDEFFKSLMFTSRNGTKCLIGDRNRVDWSKERTGCVLS